MDPRQQQDARDIELMTRWTLVMLQNAERGLVPVKALERFVDPSVLSAMGPIEPPKPGSGPFRPHVGGIRVHLVHEERAHVVCVALRADGRPAGHVLEFHREPGQRQWRITELTRVEERRLVSPADKEYSLEGRGHRRLPSDLDPLITATEQARRQAEEALQHAQAEAQRLRDQLADLGNGRSTWRNRERTKLRDKERGARLAAGRWERELRSLDGEVKELREVQALREARQLVADRDPLMTVKKPDHLERLLGPIPTEKDDLKAWRHAASAVERYRMRWRVVDEEGLGPLPRDSDSERAREHQRASEAARKYVTRSSHVEPLIASTLELEPGMG